MADKIALSPRTQSLTPARTAGPQDQKVSTMLMAQPTASSQSRAQGRRWFTNEWADSLNYTGIYARYRHYSHTPVTFTTGPHVGSPRSFS